MPPVRRPWASLTATGARSTCRNDDRRQRRGVLRSRVLDADGRAVAQVGRRNGEVACEAEVRTAGPPAAIRLRADRDTITADPRDVAHVAFEIVDAAATVAPTADTEVGFAVSGGGILALDNGDLRDHSPYRSDRKRAFNGRRLAMLRSGRPGIMRVTAKAVGLPEATVEIRVRAGSPPTAILINFAPRAAFRRSDS
jgi:hypothetical protein